MEAEFATLIQTAKQLAFLTETLERRSAAALQVQEQAGQNLAQAVVTVREDINGLVGGAGQQVAQSAQQGVSTALSQGVSRLEQSVDSITSKLATSTQSFTKSAIESKHVMNRHTMMAFLSMTGVMILLVFGGSFLLWMQAQAYNDAKARTTAAQIDAETMEAFNRVEMTSCGGRACIKLDTKSPRWGEKGEYILVDTNTKKKK
jgi:hypothetical protein